MKTTLYVSLFVVLIGYMFYGCVPVGTIQGTVSDSNGDPVQGTKITTSPEGYTAKADSAGDYVIENVEIGEYTVTASSAGLTDSTFVRLGGGSLNCQGANYDFVISSAGWITLTSPLSGTYSDAQGYVFKKENSSFTVTGEVYFYQTSVNIESNVVIRFLSGGLTFGENTHVSFGTGVKFTDDSATMMSKQVSFETGSKITLNGLKYIKSGTDAMSGFKVVDDADITNCDVSSMEIQGIADVQYCDISSLWVVSSASAVVKRCNIREVEIRDNAFLKIEYCNLTDATTTYYLFKSYIYGTTVATDNYWYDEMNISMKIGDGMDMMEGYYGTVNYNPYETVKVAPAGPQ